MIQIRVTCDVCPTQKNKTIDYKDLPSVRGIIDTYFTRIKNKSLCNVCMDTYKAKKEAMELRHQEERDALLSDLLNP